MHINNIPYAVQSHDSSVMLAQYNRFARNDYVTPAIYAEDDSNQACIVSPNICKHL